MNKIDTIHDFIEEPYLQQPMWVAIASWPKLILCQGRDITQYNP